MWQCLYDFHCTLLTLCFILLAELCDDDEVTRFLWDLYKNCQQTDVDFVLKSAQGFQTFSAHKMVLAIWSTYFADEFYEENSEKSMNIIQLNDEDPDAFETMLKYIFYLLKFS